MAHEKYGDGRWQAEVHRVARAQMLYIGQQGALQYDAPGNIEMGQGSAGTISLWYHPMDTEQSCVIFQALVDSTNLLCLYRDNRQWAWQARSGATNRIVWQISDPVAWRHVVATWDFTGAEGAGVLRLYLDGQEVAGSPVTNAVAPVGPPATIRLGPGEANPAGMSHAVMDQFAIWSEAMSAAQVAGLYAHDKDHLPQQADGTGALLMRAGWDGQFDADLAEGSAVVTLLGAADQYCRLDIGSRHQGKRFAYRIGMPAHDGSEDDRVPLMALLVPGKRGSVSQTNTAEYGQVDVEAGNVGFPVGVTLAPWMPEPARPMTLRVGLHVPTPSAPMSAPISVGAHSYYAGSSVSLSCGSGCTTNTIVSSGLTQADGTWAGAEASLITGPARNQRLRVLDNSQAAQTLTLEGNLSNAPAAGDTVLLAVPRRIESPRSDGIYHRLECNLGEAHDIERFSIVETANCGSWGYSRVDLGRVQLYPQELTRGEVFFGKREGTIYPQWTCRILIDRLEMDGPGTYQVTGKTDDSFMVTDPATGDSIKVARKAGLTREVRVPQQHPDPAQVRASLTRQGSWRHDLLYCPSWMEYDELNDRLTALLVGIDESGVKRIGYIHGTGNDGTGAVDWVDDPDPRNPIMLWDDLQKAVGSRSMPANRLAMINGVFEVGEGDWALAFSATLGLPDGFTTCALLGAPDRYTFAPQKHYDHELSPIPPPQKGWARIVPEGGGTGIMGNRDCEMRFVENPWARNAADRFWGYGRAKTICNAGPVLWYQPARPLSCVVTGDFRNLRHHPWRNQVVAPAYGWFHWPHPAWFGPSTVGLVVDDGHVNTSDVGLYVSEDGVHLQRLMSAVWRDTPPMNAPYMMPQTNPVRMGKRRLYWYRAGMSGNEIGMASIRLDGEALYRLADGEVEGELRTCDLRREGDIWEQLRLNVDPKGGTVKVAVLDAATGSVVEGFGYADCDGIGEGIEERVTWNEVSLSEVPHGEIALSFSFSRVNEEAEAPELYAWTVVPPRATDRPWAGAVQVEGRMNPARVANPEPELSWEYEDRLGQEQSAYHVLVASSQEKLDANEGDLWDSGVVLSLEQKAKYEGAALGSERTYFWKVRVRNSEGVWSEEW